MVESRAFGDNYFEGTEEENAGQPTFGFRPLSSTRQRTTPSQQVSLSSFLNICVDNSVEFHMKSTQLSHWLLFVFDVICHLDLMHTPYKRPCFPAVSISMLFILSVIVM